MFINFPLNIVDYKFQSFIMSVPSERMSIR